MTAFVDPDLAVFRDEVNEFATRSADSRTPGSTSRGVPPRGLREARRTGLLTGTPAAAVRDLSVRRSIRLLAVDPAVMEPALKAHPYWHLHKIKANTCKGDPKLIYEITKAILEPVDELKAVHPSGGEYTLERAVQVSIPLHPGAER